MVMPRSFSRSFESIARSSTRWIVAEGARLAEKLVDEGGLAMDRRAR
jgi:hypothetical protein